MEPVTTAAGRRWIDSQAAARWLAETAARLFPQSRFASCSSSIARLGGADTFFRNLRARGA